MSTLLVSLLNKSDGELSMDATAKQEIVVIEDFKLVKEILR